jgi:hypothetical protein
MPRILRAVGVAVLLFLAACTTFPEIPYERGQANPVKTIGLLTPYSPSEAGVILASSPGQSFGLVGALVDTALKAQRDSYFNEMLVAQNFSLPTYFLGQVSEALKQAGYTVVSVPVIRSEDSFVTTPPMVPAANVDAFLDIEIVNYGYIAAGIGKSNPYRPFLYLKLRLVNARDQSVLMQDIILYNPIVQSPNVVTNAPNPQYQYVDMDALLATPPDTVKGLEDAADSNARTIAKLLQ